MRLRFAGYWANGVAPSEIAEARRLIAYGARGTSTRNVLVVLNSLRVPKGRTALIFSGLHEYADGLRYSGQRIAGTLIKAPPTTEHIVTLNVNAVEAEPINACFRGRWLRQLWPEGFWLHDWRECVVFVTAHEFSHLLQWRRLIKRIGERRPIPKSTEHEADKRGCLRVNRMRAEGLSSHAVVPPLKLSDPFSDEVRELAAASRAIRNSAR